MDVPMESSLESSRGGAPWWAWPTILALDAPFVALAWYAGFAAMLGVAVRPRDALLLGLTVWLSYVADRMLDVRRLRARLAGLRASRGGGPDGAGTTTTLRHGFVDRWRVALTAAALAALAVAVVLAAGLPRDTQIAGLALTGLVAVYMAVRHVPTLRGLAPPIVPAVLMGLVFAGTTALFPIASRGFTLGAQALAPELLAFGFLCAANVHLIGRWERALADGARAAGVAWPGAGRALVTAALGAVALGAVLRTAGLVGAAAGSAPQADALAAAWIDAALAASAVGLLVVDRWKRGEVALRRVLADAVLLTPFIALALRAAL